MSRLRQILQDRRGVSFPLIVAITLSLIIILCSNQAQVPLLAVDEAEVYRLVSGCLPAGCGP